MQTPGFGATGQETSHLWQKLVPEKVSQKITGANLIGLIGALLAIACLLGLPGEQYWNIRVPLYLLVSIWTCIRPRVALYLLPLAIPWGSLDLIGGLSSADILVALLAASWLLSYLLRPHIAYRDRPTGPLDCEKSATPRSLVVAMLVLLLTMLLSMTVAANYAASAKVIVKWGEVLTVLALGSQYLRSRRQVWTIFLIVCVAGVSQALLGYAQIFLDLGPSSFVRDASLRVYGTFDQPNPYAGYLNMILAPLLALALLGHNLVMRLLAGGAALLLAGAIFYSQSKGGWIALAAALLAILLIGFPRLRSITLAVGILFLLLLCAYLIGVIPNSLLHPILTKIGVIDISFIKPTSESFANSERLAHWVVGIQMLRDHPLLGVGIGNYADVYPRYPIGIFITPLGHAHNYYINSAAEMGMLGLVAFLLFLSTFFAVGISAYRRLNARYQLAKHSSISRQITADPLEKQNAISYQSILVNDRALAIGLLAALLSVCVHNLVDNLYVHGMTSLFALLLVLLFRLEGVSAFRHTRT
jgi:O-antigen ligase